MEGPDDLNNVVASLASLSVCQKRLIVLDLNGLLIYRVFAAEASKTGISTEGSETIGQVVD
jgi:hypothetical protein